MKAIKLLTLLMGFVFLIGCGDLIDDISKAIEANKADKGQESEVCQNYKDQYLRTGETVYKEMYDKECKDDFVSENTPAELDDDCQKKYETMLLATDDIVNEMSGQCDGMEDASADCQQAADDIMKLADDFATECEIEEFYYVSLDEGKFETQTTKDGECYWPAWVPEETRQAGQTEMVDVFCQDEVACENIQVNGMYQLVEVWDGVEGEKVFLPCADQYESNCGPDEEVFHDIGTNQPVCINRNDIPVCAFPTSAEAKNGVMECVDLCAEDPANCGSACAPGEFPIWDPTTAMDVCIPEDDAPQCAPPGWIEMKDGAPFCAHPCDENWDGIVDSDEESRCSFLICPEGEFPLWDEQAQKDVCVTDLQCAPPAWPEMINGTVLCIDPCDTDRDGEVSIFEQNNCNFVACPAGQFPMYDPNRMEEVCVDDLQCLDGEYQDFINGVNSCVNPCDWNRNGYIDGDEANCKTCAAGEWAIWDPTGGSTGTGEDVCVPEAEVPFCEAPTYHEFVNGVVMCVDPCDWNRNGTIDPDEAASCVTCTVDEAMVWDADQQKDACVPQVDMPQCNPPTWPEMSGGVVTCVDGSTTTNTGFPPECDLNGNGLLDPEEKQPCLLSNPPMECDGADGTAVDGFVTIAEVDACFDPCDSNYDGFVDTYEAEQCATVTGGTVTGGTTP